MVENLFINIAAWLRGIFSGLGVPDQYNDAIMAVIEFAVILVFILVNVLWLVIMERRVSGFIQSRLGPNRVGPQGLLQSVCDAIKLLSKEFILPRHVDLPVFVLAPVLVFVPPLLMYAVLPFGRGMVAADMNIGLFYLIAVASLATIIFWMGGWASNNKYSLVGAMRAVAQMVSYEVPLVLSILGVVMIAGTLSITGIVNAQQNVWFILTQPLAFVVYFIAGIAESNRTPFDLMVGESEIINGPFTEYGGMGFAMFYLAEYVNLMIVSAITTLLFLGGWLPPLPWLDFIPSWLWFFGKMYVLIFIFMWIRWTYPRIRVDQLMGFGWKALVPLSLANIFITGAGIYIYRAIGW